MQNLTDTPHHLVLHICFSFHACNGNDVLTKLDIFSGEMSFSGSVCKCCAEPGGDLYWCLVAARNGHPTCPSIFTKINFISSFVFVRRSDWQMFSRCGWLVVSVRVCIITPVMVLCLLCAFGKGICSSIFF